MSNKEQKDNREEPGKVPDLVSITGSGGIVLPRIGVSEEN